MSKNGMFFIAAAGLLLGSAPRAAAWESLSGSRSAITSPRAVVIKDEASWRALWAEHTKGMADAPALPEADFARERIVAVFLGERTSGGATVEMTARPSRAAEGELVVSYREKRGKGGFAITLMNYPHAFRKVSNSYATVRLLSEAESSAAGEDGARAKKIAAGFWPASSDILRDGLKGTTPAGAARFFDGAAFRGFKEAAVVDARTGAAKIVKIGLPPPPGQDKKEKNGGSLPPPPGGKDKAKQGKKLPPPPGTGGKLPPPPGEGKPLPPPPARTHPRPIHPGGPLPERDLRLERASEALTTYGMTYVGFWNDGWGYERGTAELKIAAEDPSGVYQLDVASGKYEYFIEFYYDESGDAYYYARTKKKTGSRSKRLVVAFANRADKPLLPWEKESFTFGLKENTVSLVAQDGAYDYDFAFTFSSKNSDRVDVTMAARAKRKTAPDSAGVGAGMRFEGGDLKLAVTDKWADFYAEETLEVRAKIKKVEKWSFRNPLGLDSTAFDGTLSLSGEKSKDFALIPGAAGTTYYLDSWSFRRKDSKISSSGWVHRGSGNRVTK